MSIELTQTTRDLGEAPLGRLLLRLGLPAMGSMATVALYNIIDTFWVAKLGYEPVAAITVMLPFYIMAMSIGAGVGVGANALVSRRFGEKNVASANKACGQIFPLSIFFGVLFVTVAVLFPRFILNVSGATADIIDFSVVYLMILGCGMPFIIFLLAATNVLRGSGEAVKPMLFSIAGSALNIILDPLLIFGWGPFPEMGFPGAAMATTISQVTAAGITLYYIVGHKSVYRLHLRDLVPDFHIIRDIFRVGLPSIIVEFTESILFMVYNNVLASFGSMALAAGGLMIRVTDFAFMPIFGAMQGLLPIVGYCFGAGMWSRLWRAVKISCIGLSAFLLVAIAVLEIWSPAIIGLFTTDPQLDKMATDALRIVISSLPVVGITMLAVTTFQGLSMGKTALVLSLVRQFAFFVPLIILMPMYLGLTGIWIALPVSDVLSFIVISGWLFREYRVREREVQYGAAGG